MPSICCRQVYTYIIQAILLSFSSLGVLWSSLWVTSFESRWCRCEDVCAVGRRQDVVTGCATLYPRTACLRGVRLGAFLGTAVAPLVDAFVRLEGFICFC